MVSRMGPVSDSCISANLSSGGLYGFLVMSSGLYAGCSSFGGVKELKSSLYLGQPLPIRWREVSLFFWNLFEARTSQLSGLWCSSVKSPGTQGTGRLVSMMFGWFMSFSFCVENCGIQTFYIIVNYTFQTANQTSSFQNWEGIINMNMLHKYTGTF